MCNSSPELDDFYVFCCRFLYRQSNLTISKETLGKKNIEIIWINFIINKKGVKSGSLFQFELRRGDEPKWRNALLSLQNNRI